MIKEFKEFLTKTNAMALAIGVIIGAASGKVVSALVADIFMPIIGLIIPSGDWREAAWQIGMGKDATGKMAPRLIKYGDFFGAVVDFAVIALIVFIVTKALMREPAPPPPDPVQTCPFCKESNAVDATKCKACTSVLTPNA